MRKTLVVIGTRKGIFLARRRGSGRWEMDGPHLLMNVVHAIGVDTRRGFPRLLAGTSHGHWGPSLFLSDDLGASWHESERAAIRFPEVTGATLVRVWQIQAAGSDQPGVVYAGTEPAALFRSEDGGVTYHMVEGLWNHPHRQRLVEWIPEAGALYLHTVVVDPRGSDTLTVGISAGGVYRTHDSGATWTASNAGIESRSLPTRYPEFGQCVHKIAMSPLAPRQLFLQNHGGVYRSDDDAATWTPISDGLPADFGFPVVAHPYRPGTAYVFPLGADTERMPPDRRCRVYRTPDAGRSWQALVDGLPEGPYFGSVLRDAMCADDGDPAGIYFGTRGGEVFASHDEGDSWGLVADHLPDVLCVRAICTDDHAA
ncbi:MAG TPA: exo-alpha-sialidase [Actinomycetota bacterium]|nr:exo-alpha-sialidase [Actinomycetota bacterium]